MPDERCYAFLCLVPLDSNAATFFGFPEFLTSLALMVLVWTIARVRYRFRILIAPLPLYGITYSVVGTVGVLSLLTDVWLAEKWLVPSSMPLTAGMWQAILGGIFLLTFLTWAWFSFIRPPTYGRNNSQRFAQTLYHHILNGSQEDLRIIAAEIARSAATIIKHATDRGRLKNYGLNDRDRQRRRAKVEKHANDLLLLIADKRLCRAIVHSSPATALAVFYAMSRTKKYGVQVETFGKNIVSEALQNKDSFLFHEAEGYESGLIGYQKPLSQAMFSNYRMVETIGSLFDIDYFQQRGWDAAQWEAYCRALLLTIRDYLLTGAHEHSYVIYRAKGHIEHAVSDLHILNESTDSNWDSDQVRRLQVVVKFIQNVVKVMDDVGATGDVKLRVNKNDFPYSLCDHMAAMIFEMIFAASAIYAPKWLCWTVQHNCVWGEFFGSGKLDGEVGRMVKFKVRRLLYDEIKNMEGFPNFKGAKVLAYCLNVMGLELHGREHEKDSRALQNAILAWTKRNYVCLHNYNPRVAEACLVDTIKYDERVGRLTKSYPIEGLRREEHAVHLDLESSQVRS